ncbi:hypothetical protein FRC07_002061 [Ceratobasidium sp. 392]|nr:hypothetical protein FRC07_002061 [Ceratobasidium sp. 392]
MANAQPGSQVSFSPPEPPKFAVSTSVVCVNVLWFLSLSLSVGVSLVAMLGKDWARAYMAELTGQPYQQARKRQQRWDSLEEWRMPQVIMFLPTLLHLALLLFAVGLTIYLWSIHLGAAIPVLIVTVAATGAYGVSTALPLLYENCPYGTPLTQLLPVIVSYVCGRLAALKLWLGTRFSSLKEVAKHPLPMLKTYVRTLSDSLSFIYRQFRTLIPRAHPLDLETSGLKLPDSHASSMLEPAANVTDEKTLIDILTSRAIAWLLVNYEDTKSADIALQAIAGADVRLPMELLVELDVENMLYQRLLSCSATRQKTGRWYLKSPNLLEPATLYGRALAAFKLGHDERRRIFLADQKVDSNEILQCVIDQSLKQKSLSPNKAAFALASKARLGALFRDTERAAWVASSVDLLGRHCLDDLTLDDSALLTLLKAISYILGGSYSLNDSSLPSVLLQLLLVSSSGSFNSSIIGQIGVSLMIAVYSRPSSTPIQSAGSLEREANHDNYQTHRKQLLDAVNHGGSVARYSQNMVSLGLLWLLSRSHIHSFSGSDLATLSKLLGRYNDRPDSLEIHGLVVEKPGYNSRYLANTIKPRVEPGDDGSFTESELVRATYLSVVNGFFVGTLSRSESLAALRIALVNLGSATTNRLKEPCCNVLFWCSNRLDWNDQNTSDWDSSSLVQFPLLPALGLLESDDERILPYVMKTVWQTTKVVAKLNISTVAKNDALQPVLWYEPFAKYRKADIDFSRASELAESLGYAEVWLSRLENMQGEALRHVYDTEVLYAISSTLWKDLCAPQINLDSHSIRGRAVALFRRCQSEQEAARGSPLWPDDPI